MPALQMMVVRQSKSITLDPGTYEFWLYGGAGNGMNDAGAPFPTGGGGGGGAGFKKFMLTVAAATLLNISVGVGGASGILIPGDFTIRDANDTKVVDAGSATTLGVAKSGYNSGSQAGAIGGGGDGVSLAASNRGGDSQVSAGGGGGAASAGPHNATGTIGGGQSGVGVKGGGGGAGTTNGGTATTTAGAPGGLNGGGKGGDGDASLSNQGDDGDDGADWQSIADAVTDQWIDCPFGIITDELGEFVALSNGEVPGGMGAGAGGAYGGNGGRGGFPGGAGAGGADSFGSIALGGPGADGVVIIFRAPEDEGETPPTVIYPDTPPPTTTVDTVDELPPADAVIQAQRWLVRTAHLRKLGEIAVDDLRLTIKRGVGDTDSEPKIWVRANRDNKGFGKWAKRGLGKKGDRFMTICFGGFGTAKDWQFEFATTDDVEIEFRKAEILPTKLGH